MNWSVFFLLIACLANGITEGYHWSGDRLRLSRNREVNWYHVFTGVLEDRRLYHSLPRRAAVSLMNGA